LRKLFEIFSSFFVIFEMIRQITSTKMKRRGLKSDEKLGLQIKEENADSLKVMASDRRMQ
jgi:hypothetical protein